MTIDRMGSLDPLKNLGKVDKPAKSLKSGSPDSIEVSSEAKSQAELLSAREAAMAAPEVRLDRVEELKAKLQDPQYLNAKIFESTADGIMKSFGI